MGDGSSVEVGAVEGDIMHDYSKIPERGETGLWEKSKKTVNLSDYFFKMLKEVFMLSISV